MCTKQRLKLSLALQLVVAMVLALAACSSSNHVDAERTAMVGDANAQRVYFAACDTRKAPHATHGWTGPDRDIFAEAEADANAHNNANPGHDAGVLNTANLVLTTEAIECSSLGDAAKFPQVRIINSCDKPKNVTLSWTTVKENITTTHRVPANGHIDIDPPRGAWRPKLIAEKDA
jgi:hypothetical protein